MDLTSIIGLLLAVALILGSILTGSAPITAFIDIPSILVVLGGSTGAVLICFPLKTVARMPMVLKKVFLNKPPDVPQVIRQLVELAEAARRDGLLALESRLESVESPFIRMGIQMAVDGTRPELIEDILRTQIAAVAQRHREGKSMMDQAGRFAPAYGMIGTLMGLIMMLSNMSDPSTIGSGMAVALITTLYGAIVANVFFIPFAEKLSIISQKELTAMEVMMRGVLAIQAGENPRVIEQKLRTYLDPKQQKALQQAA